MTITPEDIEDDGFVVQEAGEVLNKRAMVGSSRLYSKFEEYCEMVERDPRVVLGEEFLKVADTEQYAELLMDVDVDPNKLRGDDIKINDLEKVMALADKFDVFSNGEDESGQDVVDNIVNKRLKSVGAGPLSRLDEQSNGKKDKEIKKLRGEIQELKSELSNREDGSESIDSGSSEPNEKSVDELLGTSQKQETEDKEVVEVEEIEIEEEDEENEEEQEAEKEDEEVEETEDADNFSITTGTSTEEKQELKGKEEIKEKEE